MGAKLKTKSSVAKRFKVTKSGKLRHSKTCRSHLLTNKGRSTKKHKYGKEVSVADAPRMKRMLSSRI